MQGGDDDTVKTFVKMLYRVHEKKGHDISFKEVAKGRMSTGFLDPTDGRWLY